MNESDPWLQVLALAASLGSGLIAGVFFAFSTFVMKALEARPAPEGIAAMQSINLVILRSGFMAVFLGTAVLSFVVSAWALLRWQPPASAWLLAGGVLYLLGNLAVTIAFNVPRNEGLARSDPKRPESAALWARYVREWTFWNHVRTVASLAAAAAFGVALEY